MYLGSLMRVYVDSGRPAGDGRVAGAPGKAAAHNIDGVCGWHGGRPRPLVALVHVHAVQQHHLAQQVPVHLRRCRA